VWIRKHTGILPGGYYVIADHVGGDGEGNRCFDPLKKKSVRHK
jgi:hypothetical protein